MSAKQDTILNGIVRHILTAVGGGSLYRQTDGVTFAAIYLPSDRAPEAVSVSDSPFGFGAVAWGYEIHRR